MSLMPAFLRPEWFWGLLLLPPLLWAWAMARRHAAQWRDIVDPHLLPALLVEGRGGRGWHGPLLVGLCLAVGILALAGPSWRDDPVARVRNEAPLVIVVELSSAQRAADLPPSRMLRVRLKLAQLLAERRDGQFALVAYAGDAFTVSPLTDDAATIRALLDALDPGLMPVDGQRVAPAIRHALGLIEQAGQSGGRILLVASGADDAPDALEAASQASARGVRLSVLGVGTAEGAPLPRPDGGFQTGLDGRVRLARLDEPSLRGIAARGGGAFATLSVGTEDLASLGALDTASASATGAAGMGEGRRPRDQGYWLVLPLALLFLLALRRGALAAVALGAVLVLPFSRPALAEDASDRASRAADAPATARSDWVRDDRRAWQLLQSGQAEAARSLATDPHIAGAAAYRAQDWEGALSTWSSLDGATADYNRGNALARAGRYEEAMSAYEAALARDPGFEDAQANLDAVRDWLARQPPEPEPQSGEGEGEGEGEPDAEGNEPAGESTPGDAGGEGEPQDGEPAESDGNQDGAEGDDAGQEVGAEEAQGSADAEAQAEAEAAMREAIEQALRDAADAGADEAQAAVDPDVLAEEERREALEQWLRRVPDDPGGLLRRKFALEYQRRMQEGGGQ